MSQHDDVLGRVESYLDDYEGYTPLPESIRDAVRASLPTTQQSGPRPVLERFLTMTLDLPAPARFGLVAAAALAAAVIGIGYFGGSGNVGDPADPTPTAAPRPASLLGATWVDGSLVPGPYYIDIPEYPARIEFEVPADWWNWHNAARAEESDVHAVLVNSEEIGAANGSAWGIAFAPAGEVRIDPCDPDAGTMDPSVTESAESLAAAFGTWADYPATSVEDVTIGGYQGKRVEIATDRSPCLGRLFSTPTNFAFEIQRNREAHPQPPEQFTFLDVEGTVLVIWTTDYPQTNYYEMDGGAEFDADYHADHQVALRGILESIAIVPRP